MAKINHGLKAVNPHTLIPGDKKSNSEYLSLVAKPVFTVGNFSLVSQKPSVVTDEDKLFSAKYLLPGFITFWRDLESATGHRWKCTSYLRDSPTHSKAQAIDLAPDIAPNDAHLYGANKRSDPVLYKRLPLIQSLLDLRDNVYLPFNLVLGVFIEPDHLHVQSILPSPRATTPTVIVKWKGPKAVYPDTFQRMELPLTDRAYFDSPSTI